MDSDLFPNCMDCLIEQTIESVSPQVSLEVTYLDLLDRPLAITECRVRVESYHRTVF